MISLRYGDIFCVAGEGIVSAGIRFVTKIESHDNVALYNHAGIVLARRETLEALWTTRVGTLDRYIGRTILIARPKADMRGNPITVAQKTLALHSLLHQHLGQIYPAWRIPLHIIPPLAKYLASERWLVCSELVAKYLFILDARHAQYMGTNPDTLADEWRHWRNFKIIYEGVL